MKLITNIQPPFLIDILLKQSKGLKEIKVAVAYCKDYKLFEYCKKHAIKLNYYDYLSIKASISSASLGTAWLKTSAPFWVISTSSSIRKPSPLRSGFKDKS